MSKYLTYILFNVFGKFLGKEVLAKLVKELIIDALEELKQHKFSDDPKRELRIDNFIDSIEDVLDD